LTGVVCLVFESGSVSSGFGMVSRWKRCQDRDEIRPPLGIKFQALSILNV